MGERRGEKQLLRVFHPSGIRGRQWEYSPPGGGSSQTWGSLQEKNALKEVDEDPKDFWECVRAEAFPEQKNFILVPPESTSSTGGYS